MTVRRPSPDEAAKEAAPQARLKAEAQRLRDTALAMLEQGRGQDAVEVLVRVVESLQHDNARLLLRLAAATRARYGRNSEKLNAEALKQLVLALGATDEQAAADNPTLPTVPAPSEQDAPPDEAHASTAAGKKKRPRHHGRSRLSPELPRIITPVAVPDEQRKCINCGQPMDPIGYLDSEIIEFVPARIEVHVERREKVACKTCKKDVATAPRLSSEPHQRRAGPSLLAHLIESKCDDALPVYRQQDQLRRLGFDVPVNTLYGYWDYATQLLRPVAEAILSTVLGELCVGVDDTRLDFLDPTDPRGKRRGHLWCFVGQGPLVAFTFTESWCAEDIEPWIGAIDGFIQCDDYGGYAAQLTDPEGGTRILVPAERRLGCLMHVRRRFHAAYLGRQLAAALPLKLIADIYRVEAKAKEQALPPESRLELRLRESVPKLDELDAWVDTQLPSLRPKSPLAAAAGYAKGQRPFVRRCFTDGRFEIDNGRVEREIREPAIGRKNFLFTGSVEGAERLAAAYTVVQSARRAKVPVRDYLIDIISKVAGNWPARLLTDLIPTRWAINHGQTLANQSLQ
jgi:transposase